MTDLLGSKQKVAEELTSLIENGKDIYEAIKKKPKKKTFKLQGKRHNAQVIAKTDFINICKDYLSGGLSEEVV